MKIFKNFLLISAILVISINAQPSAPQNLNSNLIKIEYDGYSKILVKLTWDKVGDSLNNNVPLYNIYRKNGDKNSISEFQKIAQVLWNSKYNDGKVVSGETYTYYVTAEKDGESAASNLTEITVNDSIEVNPTTYISGNIIDETTNMPISGIYVSAISTTTLAVSVMQSDSNGNFQIDLASGEYIIYFWASQDYFSEFYNNAEHVWDAERIVLEDNVPYPNPINVALKPINQNNNFNLSGNVSDSNGNPLTAIINIINLERNSYPNKHSRTKTDINGNFNLNISESSEIVIYADPTDKNYQGEFYLNSQSIAEATHFTMTQDFSDINFILDTKVDGNSSISGKVVNKNNEPLNAMIIATKLNFDGFLRDNSNRTFTDEYGNYIFKDLSTGEYIVFAIPEENYIPSYYSVDSSNSINWHYADIIALSDNANLVNIDFILSEKPEKPNYGFAEIDGTVQDGNDNPLSNAYVYAYDQNNNFINYAMTDQEGKYKIFGLAPGSYTINCEMTGIGEESSKNVYADFDEPSVADFTLNTDIAVGIEKEPMENTFRLNQNYPNPFNPSTIISFAVAEPGMVKLTVYDVLGKEVKSLIRKNLAAGSYNVILDASNLSAGVYIYELSTDSFRQSKKMLLLK
jgi:hypothetical protein